MNSEVLVSIIGIALSLTVLICFFVLVCNVRKIQMILTGKSLSFFKSKYNRARYFDKKEDMKEALKEIMYIEFCSLKSVGYTQKAIDDKTKYLKKEYARELNETGLEVPVFKTEDK